MELYLRIHSQHTSQPTGGEDPLIQSFTLTPKGGTHCTHYKQTTSPQTFSPTPHYCAQTPLWEFLAYFKVFSSVMAKKGNSTACLPPAQGEKPWYNITWPTATDSESLLHNPWETFSTSRHTSSVMFLIGQSSYLLHWKPTQLVAPAEKDCVNIKTQQTGPMTAGGNPPPPWRSASHSLTA